MEPEHSRTSAAAHRTVAAVVTALPMELAPVTESWGISRPEPGLVYHAPRDDSAISLTALCTGPGTINGALAMADLVRTVAPDLIIAGGIAGGITGGAVAPVPPVLPGDLVVADRTGFYDVDVTALGLPPGVLIRGGDADLVAPITPDQAELERILLAAGTDTDELRERQVHRGLILTGDCFLNGTLLRELPAQWRERLASAVAVDMESAAWATVADRAGVPWVIMRYISDDVSSGRRLHFPGACSAAGEILREFSHFFLSHTPGGWYDTR